MGRLTDLDRASVRTAEAGAPGSAYALRQRIAGSVGHFWRESFGQLFPTLAVLEAEGLPSNRDEKPGPRDQPEHAGPRAATCGRRIYLLVIPLRERSIAGDGTCLSRIEPDTRSLAP